MGKALIGWSNNFTSQGGSPRFVGMGGAGLISTEGNCQLQTKVAGKFTNLGAYVDAIGTARSLRTRKGGANQNLVISPADTTAGQYRDDTHSDAVAADDLWGLDFQRSTSSCTWSWATLAWQANADHGSYYIASATNVISFSTASTTRYLPIHGEVTFSTTEANQSALVRAGTARKFFFVTVTANGRGTNTTFVSRVDNGSGVVDGNLSVTFAAGETGTKFATAGNSDALASGYVIGTKMTTGTGTGSISVSQVGCYIENTTDQKSDVFVQSSKSRTASGTIHYFPPVGQLSSFTHTTETDCRVRPGFGCFLSNFRAYVSANTLTANATLTLRKNGVDLVSVSITQAVQNTTFGDDATPIFINGTDELSCSITGGGSGSVTIERIAYTLDANAPTYDLDAGAGGFTLSGQAVSFERTLDLQAATGAYALTGQIANLVTPGRLQADPGAFALSGQSVTLRALRTLLCGTGTFTLAGQSIAFSTAIRRIALPAGTTEWTPPDDFNVNRYRIRVFGAGGDGGNGNNGNNGSGGSGGGGRAYSQVDNVPLTIGVPCDVRVAAHGSGLTTYLKSNIAPNAIIVQAGAAQNGTDDGGNSNLPVAGGLGGQASAGIGDVCYSGGNGGQSDNGFGAGGGGDAGPDGSGRNGGPVQQAGAGYNGTGGGGCNGLLSTDGLNGNVPGNSGKGGTGPTGTPGGTVTDSGTVDGGDGSNGSGGSGGADRVHIQSFTFPDDASSGGAGGLYHMWTIDGLFYGPVAGGGGGAGHQNTANGAQFGGHGGDGGGGGGGGGAGYNAGGVTPVPGIGGDGMDAVIIIEYEPIGSFSLDALPAAYSVVGQSVTLRDTRSMVAATGIYAFNGQDAGPRGDRRLFVEPGSFLLSGSDVGFHFDYRIVALAGAYTWSGMDANLVYHVPPRAVQIDIPTASTAAMARFHPILATDRHWIATDLKYLIPRGLHIMSAEVDIYVPSSSIVQDPAPANCFDGAYELEGDTQVYQMFHNGVPGVDYVIRFVCTLNDGQQITREIFLPVRAHLGH